MNVKQIEKIKIKRKQLKPWESLIVSENLSWDEFLKINNYLYELVGVKPVMTISRDYPLVIFTLMYWDMSVNLMKKIF